MALARPSLLMDFAGMPDFLDPRVTFTRPLVPGAYFDKNQVLRYRPLNAPRFSYGFGGVSNGLLIERAVTNRLLWSEAFDNAAWTATNCTVTPNTNAAPDGNLTADTLAPSAAGGAMSQTVPVTAGNWANFQVLMAPGATNFGWLQLSDGTNTVQCWFDLLNGLVGTHTAGAGTLTYAGSGIAQLPGGWTRVRLCGASTTITSITASISAASADNTAPASGATAIAWGAQLADTSGAMANLSYIPTTTAAVARGDDIVTVPVLDPAWYNPLAGTVLATVANAIHNNAVAWGVGNTTTDYISLLVHGTGTIAVVAVSGNVTQMNLAVGPAVTVQENDAPRHVALAYQANDFAICVNGSVPATHGAPALLPVNPIRMRLGGPAWVAGAGGASTLDGSLRRFAYYPTRLSNAQIQALTAG